MNRCMYMYVYVCAFIYTYMNIYANTCNEKYFIDVIYTIHVCEYVYILNTQMCANK